MGNKVVLDNATAGTEVSSYLNSKVVCVWVRQGTADILHDGDVIVSLEVGNRKVLDGLSAGTGIVARAITGPCTLVFGDG